jgi:hypothetical protein
MIAEQDIVALTEARPDDGLNAGDVGAVVHCYSQADAYEVEFVDENGRTKCVVTVPASQILRLNLLSLSA